MKDDQPPPIEQTAAEPLRWPIGFIVMMSLAALYLVVRLVELAARFLGWLF